MIKPAVDSETEDADDDTKVQKPIEQRGNYGQTDYEPIPRAEEYCQYGDIDENDTIKAHRQTDILPILGDICQKLTLYANNVTGECGTLLMKAIHYAQAIMRDLATGRKNFLFSGSDEAAKNLAFAYSLTQSCKLCNVNPYDYREDLLTNAYNPSRTIDSFMPHLWRKQS